MFISQQRRKENVAEYLLYMWQIEDIIRANNFSIEEIEKNLISVYDLSDKQRHDYVEWFDNLINMMRAENVISQGHLQINNNVLIKLTDLHNQLIKSDKFPTYVAEYYRTLPIIVELRAKSGQHKSGEIETCFNALYGLMMLRLNKKEVSPETLIAFNQISKFVATLAAYFKKDEEKPLFDNDDSYEECSYNWGKWTIRPRVAIAVLRP